MRNNKSKLFAQLSAGIFGGTLVGIGGFLALMTYGGNNGCWPIIDSIFNGAGYESCGSLGATMGMIVGAILGIVVLGKIKITNYLITGSILLLGSFVFPFLFGIMMFWPITEDSDILIVAPIVLIFITFSTIPSIIVTIIANSINFLRHNVKKVIIIIAIFLFMLSGILIPKLAFQDFKDEFNDTTEEYACAKEQTKALLNPWERFITMNIVVTGRGFLTSTDLYTFFGIKYAEVEIGSCPEGPSKIDRFWLPSGQVTPLSPELDRTSKELLSFESKELGFSFSYPAWFGEVYFEIRKSGETGEIFKGNFENVAFEFGGITRDYSEGKEGWFTEFPGYTLENNRYYYNHLYWQFPEIESTITKLIKKIDIVDGTILLLQGSGELGMGNDLPDGVFGALVNLKNKKFHGLAFTANMTYYHKNEDKKITLEEFESILKTLTVK